jgi:hypothetical protein
LVDRNAVYPAPAINFAYFPNTENSYNWMATPPHTTSAWRGSSILAGYEYDGQKSVPHSW